MLDVDGPAPDVYQASYDISAPSEHSFCLTTNSMTAG